MGITKNNKTNNYLTKCFLFTAYKIMNTPLMITDQTTAIQAAAVATADIDAANAPPNSASVPLNSFNALVVSARYEPIVTAATIEPTIESKHPNK